MDERGVDICGEVTAFSKALVGSLGYVPEGYLAIDLGSRKSVLSEEGKCMRADLRNERLMMMWRPMKMELGEERVNLIIRGLCRAGL